MYKRQPSINLRPPLPTGSAPGESSPRPKISTRQPSGSLVIWLPTPMVKRSQTLSPRDKRPTSPPSERHASTAPFLTKYWLCIVLCCWQLCTTKRNRGDKNLHKDILNHFLKITFLIILNFGNNCRFFILQTLYPLRSPKLASHFLIFLFFSKVTREFIFTQWRYIFWVLNS